MHALADNSLYAALIELAGVLVAYGVPTDSCDLEGACVRILAISV